MQTEVLTERCVLLFRSVFFVLGNLNKVSKIKTSGPDRMTRRTYCALTNQSSTNDWKAVDPQHHSMSGPSVQIDWSTTMVWIVSWLCCDMRKIIGFPYPKIALSQVGELWQFTLVSRNQLRMDTIDLPCRNEDFRKSCHSCQFQVKAIASAKCFSQCRLCCHKNGIAGQFDAYFLPAIHSRKHDSF